MVSEARRTRFRRATEQRPPFQFTPRDSKILELVAKHRFLRSTHVVDLLGGSRPPILRRLNLLYHHGYLDRPRAQLDYFHTGGSSPLVYGLAKRGAGRLRRDLDIPFETMDWSERRKPVRRLFLEHALMVSDILVAIEVACRGTDGRIQFIPQDQLPLPPKTAASRQPFRWSITLPDGRRVGVIPDAVFALNDLSQPHQGTSVRTFSSKLTAAPCRLNARTRLYLRSPANYTPTPPRGRKTSISGDSISIVSES